MRILIRICHIAAVLAVATLFGCGGSRVVADLSPRALAEARQQMAAAPVQPATTTNVIVPLPTPTNDNEFWVSFNGLIAQVNAAGTRRAVVLAGGMFSMRHEPLLYITNPVVSSLRDASGKLVHCEGPQQQPRCWVNMDGLHARIVDTDRNPPTGGPLVEDASFKALEPHLFQKEALSGYDPNGGDDPKFNGHLRPEVVNDVVPDGAAAAYLDVADAGTLFACPFMDHQGQFVPAKGGKPTSDGQYKQFVEYEVWAGHTAKRAVLQIASGATNWNWTTVERIGSDPLVVEIFNGPARSIPRTADHFVLNQKLMPNALLSTINYNNSPCTSAVCYICPPPSIVDVPGCSDTGWP